MTPTVIFLVVAIAVWLVVMALFFRWRSRERKFQRQYWSSEVDRVMGREKQEPWDRETIDKARRIFKDIREE